MCDIKYNIHMVMDPGLENLVYNIIVLENGQKLWVSCKRGEIQ